MVTTRSASVPLFQPEMLPSSPAKRKRAGLPLDSAKSDVPLKTAPVGAGGTATSREFFMKLLASVPAYRVEVPEPWFAIQKGLEALRATPQGFLSSGSTIAGAPPGGLARSETRFADWNGLIALLR